MWVKGEKEGDTDRNTELEIDRENLAGPAFNTRYIKLLKIKLSKRQTEKIWRDQHLTQDT